MKIVFRRLQIEPTRRCNQACKHCCRGDAQSLDLNNDVVDALFDNNDIKEIYSLYIGGGEPSLNPNVINYIINKLEQNQITVRGFGLSTNGLIYSKELEDALSRLNDYCGRFQSRKSNRNGFFFISSDQFHLSPSEIAIEEYSKLPFFAPYTGVHPLDIKIIEPYGNAVKNDLVAPKEVYEQKPIESLYTVREYENEEYMIFDYLYISANGNIVYDGCSSYDMMDTQNYGNVTKDTLENIFLEPKKLTKTK